MLSLLHHILSGLGELVLHRVGYDIEPCDMLAHHLSALIPHRKKLSLHHYGIGCKGAQLLSNFLHTRTTLRELDLPDTGVKDEGVCSLAKGLSVNNSLEKLDLTGNQIGSEGTQALSQFLQATTTLVELELPYADIN